KPRFDTVGSRLVDGDAVIGAERGDTLARAAIAIAGHQPIPVQDAGDEIVVGDQHQLAHSGNHIGRGAGALPAPPPGQAYLGVDPANPMDEQNNLACIGTDIGNHVMDHGADDAPTSATRASAVFHRASSSPVTNRLAGSAASYCRKARSAA